MRLDNIKLVIFDLDGTLLDAYPAIIASFNYSMHALGYPRQSPLTIRRAVGWGDENLLKPFIKPADLPRMIRIYRKHHRRALLKGARLFPRVFALLRYLKDKGYYLAVASNRPTAFSLLLMRFLKIYPYFDFVLCADKLKTGKPNPEIINKIRQRFGCKAKETLFVGDMAIDAQAGKRAGVDTIMVTTGSCAKKELASEKPKLILANVAGLFKIL